MTAKEIIRVFESAAKANRQDRFRQGNVVNLTGPGDVVMTGDLHGNELNFDRLVRYARLDKHPNRHLILHELLHNSLSDSLHECDSYLLVARAAELKVEFPDQVHCLMGNHAMAQATRDEIIKSGKPMVRALATAINSNFSQNARFVTDALDEYILSMPIAARSDNRIWMSHSLPGMRHLKDFDNDIFQAPITMDLLMTDPSLRALIWDRTHSEKCVEKLRKAWDVDYFIVGHQPQRFGQGRPCRRMIVLASDHTHGCFLPFKLKHRYEQDELYEQIKPLAGIR